MVAGVAADEQAARHLKSWPIAAIIRCRRRQGSLLADLRSEQPNRRPSDHLRLLQWAVSLVRLLLAHRDYCSLLTKYMPTMSRAAKAVGDTAF